MKPEVHQFFLAEPVERQGLGELYFSQGDDKPLGEIEFDSGDGEKKTLIEKVILRTGTWQLRPENGASVRKPLKVFRDKAPKGHISMAELVKNFDAGVVEHVAVPLRHTDDPDQNTGYVRTLRIKDGKKKGDAELVAGIEFTEPDIAGKVKRGSIPNVSSGVLFNWLHKETGKLYQQVLDHVCLTRRPWINKMPVFGTSLSDEEREEMEEAAAFDFASEVLIDATLSEEEWNGDRSNFTDEQWQRACVLTDKNGKPALAVRHPNGAFSLGQLKSVGMAVSLPSMRSKLNASDEQMDLAKEKIKASFTALGREIDKDQPWGKALLEGEDSEDKPPSGQTVWNAEEGSGWIRNKVNRRLREMREAVIRNSLSMRDALPYYHCEDVSGDKALVTAGYGAEAEAWVVNFKVEDGDLELESFDDWVAARQEWVAAAQELNGNTNPSSPPGGRTSTVKKSSPSRISPPGVGELRCAQLAREERLGQTRPQHRTGGKHMGLKLSDLSAEAVAALTDEQREQLEQDEREEAARNEELRDLRRDKRQGDVTAKLSELEGTALDTPGFKKMIQNIYLSADEGIALEFSEHDDEGKPKGKPEGKSTVEIVDMIFAALPRDKENKIALAAQASNQPGDEKPDEEPEDESKLSQAEKDQKAEERATQLEEEMDLPWKRKNNDKQPAGAGAGGER